MTAPTKRAPRKTAAKKAAPVKRSTPAKKSTPAKAAEPAMAVPVLPEMPAPRIVARRKVVLDLDKLTKKQAYPDLDVPDEPFTFLLDGNDYELRDPRDTDWKLALELAANPFLLMRASLVGADEPVDDPTEFEVRLCRERLGLPADPPDEGSEQALEEAEDYPDGIKPCLIDRLTGVDLPGWKLQALYANWHEHYNIDLSHGKGILAALLGKVD